MACSSPGSFFKIAPIVVPEIRTKSIERSRAFHELPHADRFSPRVRRRIDTAFDNRQVHQIFRHAFLTEDRFHTREIDGGTGEPFFHVAVEAITKERKSTRLNSSH